MKVLPVNVVEAPPGALTSDIEERLPVGISLVMSDHKWLVVKQKDRAFAHWFLLGYSEGLGEFIESQLRELI